MAKKIRTRAPKVQWGQFRGVLVTVGYRQTYLIWANLILRLVFEPSFGNSPYDWQ